MNKKLFLALITGFFAVTAFSPAPVSALEKSTAKKEFSKKEYKKKKKKKLKMA